MSDIQSLIKMLQSDNHNKRCDACEELRVLPSLPPEALEALRLATNDPNPSVAAAAQWALALHDRKLEPESIETEHSKKQQTENKSFLDSALKVVVYVFVLFLLCIGLSLLSILFFPPCGFIGC